LGLQLLVVELRHQVLAMPPVHKQAQLEKVRMYKHNLQEKRKPSKSRCLTFNGEGKSRSDKLALRGKIG
jgi:hypothetical protein